MSRIGEYYQALRAKKAELLEAHPEGFLYLSPILGGAAVEVSVGHAGRFLVEGTHRESTSSEIELLAAISAENRMLSEAQSLRTAGRVALPAVSIKDR